MPPGSRVHVENIRSGLTGIEMAIGARMNKPMLWGLIGTLVGANLLFLLFGSIGVAVWGPSGGMVFGLVWWVVGGIVGGVGA